MNAIEFNTTIDRWGRIQLPEHYMNFCGKEVKVIILNYSVRELKSTVVRQYEEVKAVIRQIQD